MADANCYLREVDGDGLIFINRHLPGADRAIAALKAGAWKEISHTEFKRLKKARGK